MSVWVVALRPLTGTDLSFPAAQLVYVYHPACGATLYHLEFAALVRLRFCCDAGAVPQRESAPE